MNAYILCRYYIDVRQALNVAIDKLFMHKYDKTAPFSLFFIHFRVKTACFT